MVIRGRQAHRRLSDSLPFERKVVVLGGGESLAEHPIQSSSIPTVPCDATPPPPNRYHCMVVTTQWRIEDGHCLAHCTHTGCFSERVSLEPFDDGSWFLARKPDRCAC